VGRGHQVEVGRGDVIGNAAPDWNNAKVAELEIGAKSLYYELSAYDVKWVKLGTWMP
jgi:hypothetical protein